MTDSNATPCAPVPLFNSRAMALMLGIHHDNVERSVGVLTRYGLIDYPPIEVLYTPDGTQHAYVFKGEKGEADGRQVIQSLSPMLRHIAHELS